MVERLPVFLDLPGIFAHQHLTDLVDLGCNAKRTGGRLTPTRDAFIGFNLHKHVVARRAALRRR